MKSFILLFLCCFFLSFKAGYINRPVVYLYKNTGKKFTIQTQAIYGAKVEVLKEGKSFLFVKTKDDVKGYVHRSTVELEEDYYTDNIKRTKSLFTHVYKTDDTIPYPPLLTLPFGSYVKILNTEAKPGRWIQIELVDKTTAWIQNGDIQWEDKKLSLKEMLGFSQQFIGLPYTWGGASSFGYDCSGFVQMLYSQMGVSLPRNSKIQASSPLLKPVEKEKMLPGDLIFFGENKIGHVGLYLGDGQIIHAGVWDNTPKISKIYLKDVTVPILGIRRLKKG